MRSDFTSGCSKTWPGGDFEPLIGQGRPIPRLLEWCQLHPPEIGRNGGGLPVISFRQLYQRYVSIVSWTIAKKRSAASSGIGVRIRFRP
jgi:hypothetical protein